MLTDRTPWPDGLTDNLTDAQRRRLRGVRTRLILVAVLAVAGSVMVGFALLPTMDRLEQIDGQLSVLPSPTAGTAEEEFTLPLGLPPGTCYTEVPGADDMSDLHEVDCERPHLTELSATVALTEPFDESDWTELAEIEAACMHANHAFGTAPGEQATSPESYRHYIAWPHSSQWDDEGGRVAYCFYAARSAPTTGSLVAGTSELLPGHV
ncbi:septum formation family protein [Cellulomonas palmilytica]|uniref:septum formation family protein n=1 Tax=Cellulomonas palmilytica TaxID=2608402 RepID=UPI001F2A1B0D|nr:septum formation family protein [Cellulomonas palmilytica]UJP40840.1 hypothetical protein F1D97_04985 [Cellulomonas palmilytica]